MIWVFNKLLVKRRFVFNKRQEHKSKEEKDKT
jgi:hypothetical protein